VGVLVVGGGISGLAAARALARDGIEVTLVEVGTRLGGKVATERVDGFVIERGPDSFLATRPAAVTLARDVGLGDQLVGTRDPRAVFIRHRGRLVPMPEGLGLVLPTRAMPFARTRLFSIPEKLRMAKDVLWPRILPDDDIAVGTFLRDRLGSPLVERLAGPLVGGVYGTPIDELSLDAVVPTLRTAERDHRSLLFAGLADGRRMRAAMAARPPGAKGLGAFVSLAPGMDTLIDALAASLDGLGGTVRTGIGVRTLLRAGTSVTARFTDGSTDSFDGVVIAAPAPVAATLLADEVPGATSALSRIPHGTSILVTLAYPRDRVSHPLVGHGYLVPAAEGGAISACTWTSEKWSGRAPAGTILLRMFVRDEGAWTSLPDAELVAAARADAERTLGITGEPLLVRVGRWTGSMPRYTVGHLARVAAIDEAMTAWPAVVLAGSSYRGVVLPDCVTGSLAAVGALETHLAGHTALSREAALVG
jgi:oxygen-dependent protoporphyrinogen oxidase